MSALMQKENGTWYKGRALVVTGDEEDKRELMKLYYNAQTAGHTGVAKMLQALKKNYLWPKLREFVSDYIKGCAKCQESKTRTHPNIPPLQPITPRSPTWPFATIAMDFVVKLPPSQGYDSILTITDHNCTKVVILLPCREELDLLKVAKLYLKW
jgi:hypothetical protein